MNKERYFEELSKMSNDELLFALMYEKEQMAKAQKGANDDHDKMVILEKRREQFYLTKEYILTQRMK